MITVPDAQLLVCSTAGTDASTVLNRKVETGRAATAADVGVGVAYFEWSAPEGWDPDDEESYYTFMPALCPDPPCRCAAGDESWRHTITSMDAIRAEREAMTDPEFRRAYGNRKTSAKDEKWVVITEDDWTGLLDEASRAVDPLCFAVDMTPERSHTSISAAGLRDDGDLHGELVDHAEGTSWALRRAVELNTRWKPARWVVDAGGAAGFLIPSMLAEGLVVEPMTSRNVGQAFAMFRSATSSAERRDAPPESAETLTGSPSDDEPAEVVVPRIHIRPGRHGAALTGAAEGATTRRVGDGTTWDRKSTSVVISPIVSLTSAVWGFVTRPVEAQQQFFASWR
jgi:hypothetical protein